MRLLLFYVHDFWMKPSVKSLPDAEEAEDAIERERAVVAFVHCEPADAGRQGKVVTRAIKNLKWLAGKFDTKRAVLHYFAHLAAETAPAETARAIVESMAARLKGAGYEVAITPFGYFTEFRLHVAGESLAKVFVEV